MRLTCLDPPPPPAAHTCAWRALQSARRGIEAQLGGLGSLGYYQERRLASLGLNPVETEDELESLRAGGRMYSANDYEW